MKMAYFSILFSDKLAENKFYETKNDGIAAEMLHDLALSHILEEIKKGTPDFPEDFLLFSPYDVDTQNLRRETAEEIYGSSAVFENFKQFAARLYVLKKHRASIIEIKNKDARNHCFLSAVLEYCKDLERLCEITKNAHSRGLRLLFESAKAFLDKDLSEIYAKAETLATHVNDMLSISMRFDFFNQTIKIGESEKINASERLSSLAMDLLGVKLDFSFSAVNNVQLSPLEELLLAAMKARNPEIFEELEAFYEENKRLDFNKLIDLRDEILFFTGYIEFVKKYEEAGFKFSFLKITEGNICARGMYDISLAVKLERADLVVANDIEIEKGNIFVVSGSNQGGKTTFLRSFGQCAFLASQGLPVPSVSFSAPFFGLIATHFNRAEQVGKSRLEDEIERIKNILSRAHENSLALFNECFVGTRRGDAVLLSEKVFAKLFEFGTTCGFVTHFFELPVRDSRLVSFVADITKDGTEQRTYRILKKSPEGLAHAHSIAVACGATYEQLVAETKEVKELL